MKRNSLTTAVVAGIAGVAGFAGLANAVNINPDGVGQVLIYPYYTVNADQDSLFSVVNTDPVNGKAVKVRFLEGYNSREVLDFNLYLSPNDVWTAAVTAVDRADDTSGAKASTSDHSCTYPSIAAGQAFFNRAYAGGTVFPFTAPDGGPTGLDRTREGYLELISMGDIPPDSPLFGDVLHNQTGTPGEGTPDCSIVSSNSVTADMLVPPTGGLFGSAAVANVGQGTYYGYNADAVDGFSATVIYSGSSALEPSLQQANTDEADLTPGTTARAFVFNNGHLVTADYVAGIDAVSAVFMVDELYNEYIVGAGLGANTDWVVTFPTKRFYVDPVFVGTVPIPPFVNLFDGESNIEVAIDLFDREEGHITSSEGFSPPAGSSPSSLPFEVNVISFLPSGTTSASGVLSSNLNSNVPPYGSTGWLRLGTNPADEIHELLGGTDPASGDEVVFNGLPATGFSAYNVINSQAQPGLLANYSGLYRHKGHRSCTIGGVACS
jgi:hypothetical protein